MHLYLFIFAEALQARGARPQVVVDDDGMTMDYDDGHMDWGDDGHHHSMMMQQQSSAARIPRAPPGPPARTPLGPSRRPPGTPAKRARGSLSLIPGPKRRPRDPKKLQQRKPRSPSKKKRAARPPKAPPVQEDPNLVSDLKSSKNALLFLHFAHRDGEMKRRWLIF